MCVALTRSLVLECIGHSVHARVCCERKRPCPHETHDRRGCAHAADTSIKASSVRIPWQTPVLLYCYFSYSVYSLVYI